MVMAFQQGKNVILCVVSDQKRERGEGAHVCLVNNCMVIHIHYAVLVRAKKLAHCYLDGLFHCFMACC